MSFRPSFWSYCDGVSVASMVFEPLGWKAGLLSEIDDFPRAVLAYRWGAVPATEAGAVERGTPLWGDFTTIRLRHALRLGIALPDMLCGGTPCQGFSFAGLRGSLSDARGNLTLEFVKHVHALDNARSVRGLPGIAVLWENVPGVFSTDDNAFGCFLGALVGHDAPLPLPRGLKRWPDAGMVAGPRGRAAWRLQDLQFFGLPQRRRRVWVVFGARDGVDPAAVLFEPRGLSGNPPACVEARTRSAKRAAEGATRQGLRAQIAAAFGLGGERQCQGAEPRACGLDEVSHTLKAEGHDASEDGTGRGVPIAAVPVVYQEVATTLRARDQAKGGDSDCTDTLVPMAFGRNNTSGPIETAGALTSHGGPHGRLDFESETFICEPAYVPELSSTLVGRSSRGGGQTNSPGHNADEELIAYQCHGSNVGPLGSLRAGNGNEAGGVPFAAVPVAFSCKDYGADATEDLSPTLRAMGHAESHANAGGQLAVCFSIMPQNSGRDYKAREVEVAQPLMAGGPVGGNQGGDYVVQPVPFDTTQITSAENRSAPSPGDPSHPLAAAAHPPAIAFALRGREEGAQVEVEGDVTGALRAAEGGSSRSYVAHLWSALVGGVVWAVRRLTPRECERLMGWEDDFTKVPYRGRSADECPDGPRYKACGNSWGRHNAAWIARRLDAEVRRINSEHTKAAA